MEFLQFYRNMKTWKDFLVGLTPCYCRQACLRACECGSGRDPFFFFFLVLETRRTRGEICSCQNKWKFCNWDGRDQDLPKLVASEIGHTFSVPLFSRQKCNLEASKLRTTVGRTFSYGNARCWKAHHFRRFPPTQQTALKSLQNVDVCRQRN